MNGFIKKSSAVLAATCLLLTGCGESLKAVTPEEEAKIVTYASGIVAKSNKKQEQGITRMVANNTQDAKQPKIEEKQEPKTSETEPKTPETEPKQDTGGGENSTKEPAEPVLKTTTFTEALGMDSISAEYKGYQITKSYVQGEYFALEEREGYSYLILDITLTNQSEQPLICDIFSASPSSQLIINDTANGIYPLTTFLLNDFSSYGETIEANSSVNTVLIYEVTNEAVQAIQSMSMNLAINGNEYNIPLE